MPIVASIISRGSYHESGHVIVALHFGVKVEQVAIRAGKPATVLTLNDSKFATQERCLVLTGGIAAEQMMLGNYDRDAAKSDQHDIVLFGGEPIGNYLDCATAILAGYKPCLQALHKEFFAANVESLFRGSLRSDARLHTHGR